VFYNNCKLAGLYIILMPYMSRIHCLRVIGYVLLSVVAQPFALVIFICMCAGEDVDEGCQWEI
jgi:hypothetical protein